MDWLPHVILGPRVALAQNDKYVPDCRGAFPQLSFIALFSNSLAAYKLELSTLGFSYG